MSNANESTKNSQAWEVLFDKYNILENIDKSTYFEISATQINEFREARLMTKFDHKINLPKLFSENDLAILPITRGNYVISKFEAYKEFEECNSQIFPASFPEYIQSIDYENMTSEAMAINCAYVSGILGDFLEDQDLIPTVSGRMSSGTFDFEIRNTAMNKNIVLNVSNSQIEIDGGYEGISSLSIIEAKNFISEDFLIRQLYYPYRLWNANITKKIKPVFMVYSNSVFSLYEYLFDNPNNYNSLTLVKQKNYSIETVEISLEDIIQVYQRVLFTEEPEIAFPQADSFKRVINLCELLSEGDKTRDEITLNYAFDPRQTNYYTDAARYLGLVDKKRENNEIIYFLTEQGKKLQKMKFKARQLKYVEHVLQHKVFRDTLSLYLCKRDMPSRSEIVEIMKESNLYHVEAESTYERRASTVLGWINWILDLQR